MTRIEKIVEKAFNKTAVLLRPIVPSVLDMQKMFSKYYDNITNITNTMISIESEYANIYISNYIEDEEYRYITYRDGMDFLPYYYDDVTFLSF